MCQTAETPATEVEESPVENPTETAAPGLLPSCEYLLAGNAIFTVVHEETGERYTLHFYRPKQGRDRGNMLVRLLTGPNNTADYSRVGMVNEALGVLELDGAIGTGKGGVPTSAALARWIVALASTKSLIPAGLELHHAGRCLRCGRLLTVPYPANPYRQYGLGPDCGAM